jgi:hypothetical protein
LLALRVSENGRMTRRMEFEKFFAVTPVHRVVSAPARDLREIGGRQSGISSGRENYREIRASEKFAGELV